jgi:3-deoxy-D-manno-octulosonate 8-phosphate phosphatase (KDO 8-P phosphatase)
LERDPHVIAPQVARRIKLVGLDVDGVLTDGGIYLGSADADELSNGVGSLLGHRPLVPFELKRYDIQDGIGITFLKRAGIKVAIVTGRVSQSVKMRAKELGIDDVAQDPDAQKLRGFVDILSKHGLFPDEAAFLGDDFPDVPILREVGLPVAVGNAVPEVRAMCSLRLTQRGGFGAVREFAELLLKARGEWKSVTDAYVAERSIELPWNDRQRKKGRT